MYKRQDGDNGADAYAPGQSTDAKEEYPKVTSQTEDEVVIDFTDTEKPKETPPPVPEGKTEIKDPGQEHTVNPDPSVPEVTAPPAEQTPPSNDPVPGSSNGNGAVYDPVFGWVVPGNVQQSTGEDVYKRQSVICQQRLSSQFRHEDVHGLILGNSMDLAYQILTSTGGRKHDFFMLDGSYEHFLYLTNDHQGEVTLALLCDPGKTAELDRILLQGLTARQPGLAIEHDGISPDGSPVLFGYFCDLPRIARFNTSLELSERPGTLICFDFQAEVLRSYCGSRVRFQTIDFTKFEGRLFP